MGRVIYTCPYDTKNVLFRRKSIVSAKLVVDNFLFLQGPERLIILEAFQAVQAKTQFLKKG